MLWHITTEADWQQAQHNEDYRPASLTTEGFIHCSTTEQIAATADRFFAERTDLIALAIAEDKVTAPIRYEDLNAGDLFPHLYGPLNFDAVLMAIHYAPGSDGKFRTPLVD